MCNFQKGQTFVELHDKVMLVHVCICLLCLYFSSEVERAVLWEIPKLVMTSTVLILAVCLSHMNSVKWPCSPGVPVTQWIEHPPSVREVMGSIPVGDSDFFFVPRSCHVDQFTFHILSPSLKFTIYSLIISYNVLFFCLFVCFCLFSPLQNWTLNVENLLKHIPRWSHALLYVCCGWVANQNLKIEVLLKCILSVQHFMFLFWMHNTCILLTL